MVPLAHVPNATDCDVTDPQSGPVGRGRRGAERRRAVTGHVDTNPRQALVEALATAVARGAAVGDVEFARVAHDALGRLLGLGSAEVGAAMLDLGAFRHRPTDGGGSSGG